MIAGLDRDNKPYICAMDLLGAPLLTEDFVLAGTCSENLYGMCESLYRPNMVRSKIELQFPYFTQEPEDLFETISQALLSAVDRDAISGWGGIVHIMCAHLRCLTRSH